MDIYKFSEKFNAWYYLTFMMEGIEAYPISKQIASWFYLDTKAVHPDILINARPLYIEEVKGSFESAKVLN